VSGNPPKGKHAKPNPAPRPPSKPPRTPINTKPIRFALDLCAVALPAWLLVASMTYAAWSARWI
jgi:hypothetical protein